MRRVRDPGVPGEPLERERGGGARGARASETYTVYGLHWSLRTRASKMREAYAKLLVTYGISHLK